MRWEDCGYKDDRQADIARGRCPDCGDVKGAMGKCHCNTEPPEPSVSDAPVDHDIPF